MAAYTTVTEALADLKTRGYTLDFNLFFDHLKTTLDEQPFYPDAFEITEWHRFEGNTDPGDEMVVYAIASKDRLRKGVLITGYGMYNDDIDQKLLEKLKFATRQHLAPET